MPINTGIPQTLIPGVGIKHDLTGSAAGIPAYKVVVAIIGQRLKKKIESELFYDAGLDDLTTSGTFVGDVRTRFIIEIDLADTPDKFKWSSDNGRSYTESVTITGSAQTLEDGVIVTFGATTGHTLGDQWIFHAYPEPTVAEKELTRVYTADSAATQFGVGSMVHLACIIAFKNNRNIELNVIALDDNGSGNAAGDITISNTAGVSGSVTVYIANEAIEVAVAKDATAAEIALALQIAMDNKPFLPIRAAIDETTDTKINITALNAGTVGNEIQINYAKSIDSVSVTITDMSGGAVDPDIQDGLDILALSKFDIIMPTYNDSASLAKLKTHLLAITEPDEKKWGIGIVGTTENVDTVIIKGGLLNYESICIGASRASWSQSYEIAAALVGIESTKTSSNEALNDRVLIGIHAPDLASGKRYLTIEIKALLAAGITPIAVNESQEPYIVRMMSTRTSFAGVDITTGYDLNIIQSTNYVSVAIEAMEKRSYTGTKFTAFKLVALQASIVIVLQDLEELEILRDVEANRDLVICEANTSDPYRADTQIPISIVTTLHYVANKLIITVGGK